LALLPKRTAELAGVIGLAAALVLVKEFGGTHLNIPAKAKPSHKLVAYIGMAAYEQLCHYYAGTKLEIDLCAGIINKQKEQLIVNAIAMGRTNAVLARKFGTTERQIRRIKERMRCVTWANLDIFESLAS
jgi:NaMN:DMB phosphoribosyltransferase